MFISMADENIPSAGEGQAPSGSPEATPQDSPSGAPSNFSGSTASGSESENLAPVTSGNAGELPERTREKYAHLESENTDLKSRFGRVAGFIQQDPELYLKALKETSGLSHEEAVQEVMKVHPSYGGNAPVQQDYQPQGQAAPIVPALNPMQQVALSKLEQQEQELADQRLSAAAEFKKKYPNLGRDQTTAVIATTLMYENQGLPPAQALEKARVQILEPEKFRKLGEIEGMSKAYSSMGSSSIGSGGGAPIKSSSQLTELDEEVMRKLGLDRDPKLKESYMSLRDS